MRVLILLDFDGTLFDIVRMKKDKSLKYRERGVDPNKYDEIYKQVKQEFGFANMEEVYRRLNQAREGWGDIVKGVDATFPYQNYLFTNALRALKILSQIGDVVIFTQGDTDGDESSDCYQACKIRSCNLGYPARIFRQKVDALPDLIQDYLNKYERFILIDDSDEVLNSAKNLGYHNIICIKIGESERYESYPNIYEAALAIRGFISS
jgi:hypothetical protein